MKTVLLFLLTFYKNFLSPLLRQILGTPVQCRYSISCSAYAIESISKYGSFIGSKKAIMRLLSCQPFYNHYEPV